MYHIISYIISHHISYHIIYITSHHIISYVTSHHIIYHIMYHVISYIISHHITSYIISYYIISYHVISTFLWHVMYTKINSQNYSFTNSYLFFNLCVEHHVARNKILPKLPARHKGLSRPDADPHVRRTPHISRALLSVLHEIISVQKYCRSQWPHGLRRGSATARLLILWVRIPWMSVRCECCVLSGRGLCDVLITRQEQSYRLWCVIVCNLENS